MANKTLEPNFLIQAYANGYFPMPDPLTEEINWYRPDPRAIIPLSDFHCSRSLKRRINKHDYDIKLDSDFLGVMTACSQRKNTWINQEFFKTYHKLHEMGVAHSLEVWIKGDLVGGVYGVALGGAFFAESKFHRVTDASKLAIYHLVKHLSESGFTLLEVQFLTPHLETLGAMEIPGHYYQDLLSNALKIRAKWLTYDDRQ